MKKYYFGKQLLDLVGVGGLDMVLNVQMEYPPD
jgi:hypothetical protein